MNFYPENYDVEAVVLFTDLNGVAITPTAIRAVLLNGEDEEMVDFGSMPFDAPSGSKSILINAAFNFVEEGSVRAPRVLRIEIDTAAGTITKIFSYVIEIEQSLAIMVNSFQTYETASIFAMETVNSVGWTMADEDRRRAALAEAFRRLTNIPMRYSFRDLDGRMDITTETFIARDQWADIDADAFKLLPTHFKRVLRQAQFLEADDLLQGDQATVKHRAGIVSETVGESSMTLRAGKIDYGIGTAALKALVGYLDFNMRIVRA